MKPDNGLIVLITMCILLILTWYSLLLAPVHLEGELQINNEVLNIGLRQLNNSAISPVNSSNVPVVLKWKVDVPAYYVLLVTRT